MTSSSCQSRFNLAATRPKEAKNFRKKREAVRPEVDQPDRKTRSLLRCRPAAKKRGDRILNMHRVLPSPKRKFLSFGWSLRETANDARKGPPLSSIRRWNRRARERASTVALHRNTRCRVRPDENGERVWLRSVRTRIYDHLSSLVATPLWLPIRRCWLNFAGLRFVPSPVYLNYKRQQDLPVERAGASSNFITTAETNSVIIYK